jgi:hypothetical protein
VRSRALMTVLTGIAGTIWYQTTLEQVEQLAGDWFVRYVHPA